MTDEDEASLVRRVAEGEVEAFAAIVARYQRPIFRFVLNMLSSPHEAEDVAQEVFLAAFKNLHGFDRCKGRLSTWLFAIARNRAFHVIEKRRPHGSVTAQMSGEVADPSVGLQRDETFAALDAALAGLPPAQRMAFVLAEIEGMSLSEVAAIEAVPVGTIKSRLSRAKEALRSALRHEHGAER